MSKEQIEEIKNKFHSFLNQSERSTIAISQNHLNLLIEQAERVQDLEEFVSSIEWQTKTLKKRQGEINRLNEQNKRYREAMEIIKEIISSNVDDERAVLFRVENIVRKMLEGDSHESS